MSRRAHSETRSRRPRRPYITAARAPRRFGRGWAVLALVALLFQAVVPTYAMAAAQPDSETLVPICTSSGIIYVSLDEDGEPLPADPPAQKPCRFCLSKATPFAIPQVIGTADCGTASELAAPPLDAELAVAKARIRPQPIRAPPHIL